MRRSHLAARTPDDAEIQIDIVDDLKGLAGALPSDAPRLRARIVGILERLHVRGALDPAQEAELRAAQSRR